MEQRDANEALKGRSIIRPRPRRPTPVAGRFPLNWAERWAKLKRPIEFDSKVPAGRAASELESARQSARPGSK